MLVVTCLIPPPESQEFSQPGVRNPLFTLFIWHESFQHSLAGSHMLLLPWPIHRNAASYLLILPNSTAEPIKFGESSLFPPAMIWIQTIPGIPAVAPRWQSDYMKCTSNSSTKSFWEFSRILNWASATNGFYAEKGMSFLPAWTGFFFFCKVLPCTPQVLTA